MAARLSFTGSVKGNDATLKKAFSGTGFLQLFHHSRWEIYRLVTAYYKTRVFKVFNAFLKIVFKLIILLL